MNFGALRTLVLTYSDDPNGGYFTTAIVNVFLNNAQREVQKKLVAYGANYYIKCVQTTTVINQRNYALPVDFKQLNRIELVTSGTVPNESFIPLMPLTLNQRDLVPNGPAQPQCYTIKKNDLFLYPCPQSAQTMRMEYTYLVADMVNDGDVPDVPESYHELISLYAARDCYLKDQRTPDLILLKIKFYEEQMTTDANERNKDYPRNIVDTGSDDDVGYQF